MLKTFRRIFAQRTPVEFQVYRREQPAEPESSLDQNIQPTVDGSSADAEGILRAVASVRTDLERQFATQEQLTSTLSQIQPLGQQITQRLDAISGTERHLAELVHSFSTDAVSRDTALQSTMKTINENAERQIQTLTVLHEQIDRSQNSMQELTHSFNEVGAGIDALLNAQKSTSQNTAELVHVVRDQTEAIASQQHRTFWITIAALALATGALVVAIIFAAIS